MRVLRDLGGDGAPAVVSELVPFGPSRVFGTVRANVVAWDVTTGIFHMD